MTQPDCGIFAKGLPLKARPGLSLGLLVIFLAACGPASTPLGTPGLTPTPAETPCFWNWAYGAGSPEFEAAVRQDFAADAISGTVQTSSYGETYSCDNSYHAMSLDVELEVQAADLGDQAALAALAEKIDAIVRKEMQVSTVPNLGNFHLTFVNPAQPGKCPWDFENKQCLSP